MKIVGSKIPEKSLTQKYLPCNFWDVYKCTIQSESTITPDDLQVSFWTHQPKWLARLFSIRNAIVKWFGLKTDKGEFQKIEQCIREDKTYNMMSVAGKSGQETAITLKDKHLNAYMSVYIEDRQSNSKDIYVITIVHFNNLLGYLYFYTIAPFHKMVVKGMMKHTLNRIIANPNNTP